MHSTEEITLNLILSLLFVRDFPNTNLKRAQINIKYKIKRITKTRKLRPDTAPSAFKFGLH